MRPAPLFLWPAIVFSLHSFLAFPGTARKPLRPCRSISLFDTETRRYYARQSLGSDYDAAVQGLFYFWMGTANARKSREVAGTRLRPYSRPQRLGCRS